MDPAWKIQLHEAKERWFWKYALQALAEEESIPLGWSFQGTTIVATSGVGGRR